MTKASLTATQATVATPALFNASYFSTNPGTCFREHCTNYAPFFKEYSTVGVKAPGTAKTTHYDEIMSWVILLQLLNILLLGNSQKLM